MADKLLRAHRKREAADLFNKSIENMQKNKTKTNKLGLAHLKLASICLSDLEYQRAIMLSRQSLLAFEDYEKATGSIGFLNEPHKVKAYELLARVFEICDQRS